MEPNRTGWLIRTACAALAVSCLTVSGAGAQDSSAKTVFENYQLLGIFAFDCGKPASANNYYYVHRLLDPGHVQRDRMIGTDSRDYAYVIDRALVMTPNQVSLNGIRSEGSRKGEFIKEVWRVEPNRIMTIEQTIGGNTVISGARFNGRSVPRYNRCSALNASSLQTGGAGPTGGGVVNSSQQVATSDGGCHTENYTFSTVLSQSATTNSVSTGGASCVYKVGPVHPEQVQFTDASIVRRPRNGNFEQTEAFAFRYRPNPGFRGTDEYAIKGVLRLGTASRAGRWLVKCNI